VGRVASQAKLLGDPALTKSVFNDLVERAAGVGCRLLVSRIAGTTTLAGRDAAEQGTGAGQGMGMGQVTVVRQSGGVSHT
jgi:hypothetical protein